MTVPAAPSIGSRLPFIRPFMTAGSAVPFTQHNTEISSNRRAWEEKPLLREIYRGFYETIAAELQRNVSGATVELGSGMGNIKQIIPACITTDIFPNPWLDRQENAYALSFADASVANLILFDVWHHLEYPGDALAQFARVLAPGGRLIIFDPAMSLLGRLVYGCFHHEPLGLYRPIAWRAPAGSDLSAAPYFAAQSYAWRMFVKGECTELRTGWRVVRVRHFASLAYVGTGGFSKPQLFPSGLLGAVRAFDRVLSALPRLFATRMLVVLEKV